MVGFDNARMLTDYAQKSSDVVHENGEKGKFCVQTSVGIIYIYIYYHSNIYNEDSTFSFLFNISRVWLI